MAVRSSILKLDPAQLIADDPLKEFFVWWDDVKPSDVDGLAACLQTASKEQDLQYFLEKHPLLLAQLMHGGHGRWVIPQKRLGSEYVSDFMLGERSSIGFEWHAVELESPRTRMFNKSGDPTRELTHAIRQIQDWRAWLTRNQNYASRDRSQGGLGLIDISPSVHGIIIMGRREELADNADRRRQMVVDLGIDIHSFDWLVDATRGHVPFDRWNAGVALHGKTLTTAQWATIHARQLQRPSA